MVLSITRHGRAPVLMTLLVVVSLTSLSACAGPSSPKDGAPATSDLEVAEFEGAVTPVPAAEYRKALKDLARSDTGRFQLVVRAKDREDAGLAVFPRMRGSWRLSTSEATQETRIEHTEQGPVELHYRLVDGQSFVRISFEGSAFGKDCWAKMDFSAPELAKSPTAGQQPGLPAAIYLFDGYQPAGRRAAGTARLTDVLGAIGFQKLASTNPHLLRKARMPIDPQLDEGRLLRILIRPSDLVDALDSLPRESSIAGGMEEILDQAPLLGWEIDYSNFGERVVIEAPPTNKLVEFGDSTSRCADGR